MVTKARRSLSDMRERAKLAMKFCSLWLSMTCLKRFSLLLMQSNLITPTRGNLHVSALLVEISPGHDSVLKPAQCSRNCRTRDQLVLGMTQ